MDPAAVEAQFLPLFTAFPDWHWEMRNFLADGDYLAVHFTVTGTHRGDFRGIEATGRRHACGTTDVAGLMRASRPPHYFHLRHQHDLVRHAPVRQRSHRVRRRRRNRHRRGG
ncbi:ester cyclase [Nocardia australiensis]|uniref:ester cyclase n=1 Tax=Nocardia australiensis TaxID=2887191 RepID=UPI001D15AEBC